MIAIVRMAVFDIIPTLLMDQSTRKALPAKWVFATKRNREGKIEKFKARWVACGDL